MCACGWQEKNGVFVSYTIIVCVCCYVLCVVCSVSDVCGSNE